MKPFIMKPLMKGSWFQKLAGIERLENFTIEVNNLLAQVNSAKEIPETAIKELLKKYKLDSFLVRKDVRKKLLTLIEEYLKHVIADKKFDESEKEEIQTLLKLFDIPEDMFKKTYKNFMESAIRDYINQALADGSWSPEEEKALFDFAKEFHVNLTFDPETEKLLEDYRFAWQIEQGNLPLHLSPSLLLKKDEKCYWETEANLREWKKEVKSYSVGGAGISFRVAKGIYLRSGRGTVQKEVTETIKDVDSGIFCVTSERIIFKGLKKNITVPYNKIIYLELYPVGIFIHKGSGKPIIFDMDEKRKVYLLLVKLIEQIKT